MVRLSAAPSLRPVPGVDVTVCSAETAEHAVAALAEQQLLVWVGAALGHDLPPLPGHQVPQLVDEEGGRQGLDPAGGDCDQFPAHRTPSIGTSIITKPLSGFHCIQRNISSLKRTP